MTSRRSLTAAVVATFLVATAGLAPAQDGRLSLAERVARLEQSQQSQPAPSTGANLELLNRIQDLQTELQSLRNLVEQQRFEIDELKQRQTDQYTDLDDRIQRLQGGDPGQPLDLRASAPANVPAVPAAPVDPNQLQMESAVPVDPYTGEPMQAATPNVAAPPVSAASPALDPQVEYQAAFDALKQGRYDESSRLFNQFLRNHPDHELADNALYWLGESYYVTQNYETALQTFRTMTERYPDGDKAADAELKIGYCLYELGQYAGAQQALQNVVARYSGSTVARLAESRLRALALENL